MFVDFVVVVVVVVVVVEHLGSYNTFYLDMVAAVAVVFVAVMVFVDEH